MSKQKRVYKKRMTKQKGGKVFGKGAFGTVFGEPRIPCNNETLEDVSDINQVSKVFEGQRIALKEFSVLTRLKESLGDDYDKINEYAVLPIKECNINVGEIKKYSVYTDKEWSSYKGKDLSGILFKRDQYAPEPWQVVYPQAEGDLNKETSMLTNFELYKEFITKLLNICKGVQFLQNHYLIHGDLKLGNTVSIDGTYKLIDMAEVNNMKTMTIMPNLMSYSYEYFTWPSIVAWTSYYDRDVKGEIEEEDEYRRENDEPLLYNEFYNEDGEKEMTNKGLVYLYHNSSDFNSDSIQRYIPFLNVINTTGILGLTDDDAAMINKINFKIMGEKLFNYPKFTEKYHDDDRFLEALKAPKTLPLIETYNTWINSFDSDEEAKIDLLKRVDIYSLGIMIITSINRYFGRSRTLRSNEREFIMKLVDIAGECCIQNERTADINAITSKWEALVGVKSSTDKADQVSGGAAAGAAGGSETHTISPKDIEPVIEEKESEEVSDAAGAAGGSETPTISPKDIEPVIKEKESEEVSKTPEQPQKQGFFAFFGNLLRNRRKTLKKERLASKPPTKGGKRTLKKKNHKRKNKKTKRKQSNKRRFNKTIKHGSKKHNKSTRSKQRRKHTTKKN